MDLFEWIFSSDEDDTIPPNERAESYAYALGRLVEENHLIEEPYAENILKHLFEFLLSEELDSEIADNLRTATQQFKEHYLHLNESESLRRLRTLAGISDKK